MLYEERPFPSDEYAIHSHMKLHKIDPTAATVMLRARKVESYFSASVTKIPSRPSIRFESAKLFENFEM